MPSIPPQFWKGKSVLITGGTGSFGKRFIKIAVKELELEKLIIFSRDELKQHEMKIGGYDHPSLRYFIGDIRDKDRLVRAMQGVDVVVHAAALKQVPACEYNPIEAIMTNVMGTRNVIDAAVDCGVKRILALSTDKAVNPINLYGATKLCAEKLIIQANSYSGANGPRFSCVRYGNVVGSRGSVIPVFKEQIPSGRVTVTDPRMSRFWITLDRGVRFVMNCIETMQGAEVFIPKIPSMEISELVKAIAPNCKIEIIGIRPGEKLHECLISQDESYMALDADHMFIIRPQYYSGERNSWTGKPVPAGFRYSSDSNTAWLKVDDLQKLIVNDESPSSEPTEMSDNALAA